MGRSAPTAMSMGIGQRRPVAAMIRTPGMTAAPMPARIGFNRFFAHAVRLRRMRVSRPFTVHVMSRAAAMDPMTVRYAHDASTTARPHRHIASGTMRVSHPQSRHAAITPSIASGFEGSSPPDSQRDARR